MDPASQPAPRMCTKHGVVRDPLGHCVICRREDAEEDDDPGGSRKAISALVLLAVGVGCVLLYRGMMKTRVEPPIVRVEATAQAQTTQAAPIDDEVATAQENARAAAQARETEEKKAALEKKMRQVPIQIYSTKWCELCKTATAYFKTRGFTFTELDVETSPESLAAMSKRNPKNTVPTIVVEDEVIVGFGPGAVSAAVYRAAEKKMR